MTDNDIKRLQAAELHEAMPETGIEVDVFGRKDGNFNAAIKETNWRLDKTGDMLLLSDEWGEILMYDHEIDMVIALLQKAREIMVKGGA